MFTKPFSKILGLTLHEIEVLEALQTQEQSISGLARLTKIPRTTLYTTVDSLSERTLVNTRKDANQTIVSLSDRSRIDAVLFSETSLVQSDDNWAKSPDFKIIYGLENLIDVYQKICEQKNKRVYSIQPTRSMLAVIKKVSPEKLVELNEMVRNNKIIFDTIIHQNYMTKYMDRYLIEEGSHKTQKDILSSLEKRMSDTSVIDNEYLNAGSEIYFTDMEMHILNWQDESCIEIKNKEIIALIKGLFVFAKAHGLSINYHALIAKHMRRVSGEIQKPHHL